MKKTKNLEYDPVKIEKKWQMSWDKKKIFQVKNNFKGKKFYGLIEFPYPSGEGLHVGHIRSNTAMDIISRKRRMEGYNVLYPIGWDAFGLPTENYAIKTGISPEKVTKRNTDIFRKQLKSVGFSFDWSREINTTDPKYYKWTQWIFLQFLKNDLAYKAKININWCPKDKIGLANEEVIDGKCERCGTLVERRKKEQWMLRITKYADRLDKDLDNVDFLEKIKLQQRNWIGKSEGAEIDFDIKESNEKIKVFTTRPDTIFGATYVVIAPENPLVLKIQEKISNWREVEKYINESKNKEEIERVAEEREKTGVRLDGIFAINPVNKNEIPVFVADYVLASYGTGAVMAVPAHDHRDFAFAKKYGLSIVKTIIPRMIDYKNPHVEGKQIVFRKAVIVIVRNPKNGKILCLKWKKHPWTTFVMGGIEENETPENASRREVYEETGYKNLKFVKIIVGPIQSEFFAAHKNVNRIAHTWSVLFDLENEEKDEISEEESKIHEIEWKSMKEITSETMTHIETKMILDKLKNGESSYIDYGVLINSDRFNGRESEDVKKEITEFAHGKWVTKFKLRDWVFSRQRYWGEPIPVVHCQKCGIVPLKEKDLPLTLPKVKKYQPTDTGESPLATISKWVNTKCPVCGGKAKRETDTMPNWAGSSWYFLRYIDPKNSKQFADFKNLKKWMQVDWYNGGMEHTTLHLLYSRFWNKFLYDIGCVPFSEPYKKRTSHGMVLAKGGEKMSKSKGNVINPDEIVKTYGADTLRMYEMFMGPFDQAIAWDEKNIIGVRRFLEKVWRIYNYVIYSKPTTKEQFDISLLHSTIKKVGEGIEKMSFNTAISSMMILANSMDSHISKGGILKKNDFSLFIKIISPFAPHIAEEMWNGIGNKGFVSLEKWPKADLKKIKNSNIKIAIQINGKLRADVSIEAGMTKEEVFKLASNVPTVDKWIAGRKISNIIYVPERLMNICLDLT